MGAELVAGAAYESELVSLFEFDEESRVERTTEYFNPLPFATLAGGRSAPPQGRPRAPMFRGAALTGPFRASG